MVIDISVVIPVYCNEAHLDALYSRLKSSLSAIVGAHEIIFVNDGSPDGSEDKIARLAAADSAVRGINLSKNYGQHQAVFAGLEKSRGRWVVVMDADLQDLPEEIPALYHQMVVMHCDMVVARRCSRSDSFSAKLFSSLFYRIYNLLLDFEYDGSTANFGIYSRFVIDKILLFKERDQSFGYLANIVGFKKEYLDVSHGQRLSGKSSYGFYKKINLAFDYLFSNSIRPLKAIIFLGFLLSTFSLLGSIVILLKYFLYGSTTQGWVSLSFGISLGFGIILFFLGIMGIYIGKIFMEVKKRPQYIIRE